MGFKAVLSSFLASKGRAAEIHRGTASEQTASEEIGGQSYDFSLSGSLDRGSAPSIRKVMFEEALRHREVRIDLSGLELIDSAGLATLVEAFAAAKRNGVDMVFHRPSESVCRVLRFTRLDQVLPILDSPVPRNLSRTAPVGRGGTFTRTRLRPSPTAA